MDWAVKRRPHAVQRQRWPRAVSVRPDASVRCRTVHMPCPVSFLDQRLVIVPPIPLQQNLRERQPEQFDVWLADCTASGMPELQVFAVTLRRDEDAVRNALREVWIQGQTEGQITRLKLIRRHMYGCGKLDLLSRRVLAVA